MKVKSNGDLRLMAEKLLEHSKRRSRKKPLDSLEIKKEVDVKLPKKRRRKARRSEKLPAKPEDVREIKLLFVTFKEEGEPVYKVEGVEKHAESGLWKPTYVSPYDAPSRLLKERLAEGNARMGSKGTAPTRTTTWIQRMINA